MKEIKNNFKCCDKINFSNDLLIELESKEEFACGIRGACMGFSGEDIPADNCFGVAFNGGCGIDHENNCLGVNNQLQFNDHIHPDNHCGIFGVDNPGVLNMLNIIFRNIFGRNGEN